MAGEDRPCLGGLHSDGAFSHHRVSVAPARVGVLSGRLHQGTPGCVWRQSLLSRLGVGAPGSWVRPGAAGRPAAHRCPPQNCLGQTVSSVGAETPGLGLGACLVSGPRSSAFSIGQVSWDAGTTLGPGLWGLPGPAGLPTHISASWWRELTTRLNQLVPVRPAAGAAGFEGPALHSRAWSTVVWDTHLLPDPRRSQREVAFRCKH